MTNRSPDNHSSVRPNIVAIMIIVLLLAVAALQLPAPSGPYVTVITEPSILLRNGPGIVWVPPVASLDVNQTVPLLARTPNGRWFKVIYNGRLVWLRAADVRPSIDPVQVPVDAGPPAPTLTPSPPTAVPIPLESGQSTFNLVLGNIKFSDPLPITCGKPISVSMDITAVGSLEPSYVGTISISDVEASTGLDAGHFYKRIDQLHIGQTTTVCGMILTVIPYSGERHKLTVRVDTYSIPETSYADNSREFVYTLQGDCG